MCKRPAGASTRASLHACDQMLIALTCAMTAGPHSMLADAGFMKRFQLVHLGISNDEDEVAPSASIVLPTAT